MNSIDAQEIPDRDPKPAYSYRQGTGEYVGETTADPDPLESDNWLVPAQATLVQPPAQEINKVAVWDGVQWASVDDLRGVKYSKVDGSAVLWSELGAIPEELTELPYPGPFNKWNGAEWKFDVEAEQLELASKTVIARDSLLAIAALRIAPLQDAVDVDDASPDDVAKLKKWKQYRVALNRIDQQAGYPTEIEWPVEPS
ncbi:tail fiber assembly protein [Pseudomonas proteolytica]|uniref:tail fiber assembly protein n=1 Tax=Pseudomonas proteolytica TaxID=219574 RepID=UPI00147565E5|nr:tail fiber assembly protein [Pseudomonas proteolytica]NMZ37094.1 tail fiber assembly protein [Pseudomonas proteolytica]